MTLKTFVLTSSKSDSTALHGYLYLCVWLHCLRVCECVKLEKAYQYGLVYLHVLTNDGRNWWYMSTVGPWGLISFSI